MSGNLLGDDLCHFGDRQEEKQLVRMEEKKPQHSWVLKNLSVGQKLKYTVCRMDEAGEDLKYSIAFLFHQNPG